MDAFKRLKRHSVVVYVDHKDKTRWEQLCPTICGAFYGKNMGHIYPKAVVSSPDQYEVFAMMNHKQLQEASEYSKVSKITKKALNGELPEVKPVFEPSWAVKESSGVLTGPFVKLVGDKRLYLRIKGKEYGNDINEFSVGAQAYARYLSGGKQVEKEPVAAEGAEEPAEDVIETWESAKNNKTIKASFVSLKGDKITLKKENGKVLTFSISLLSEKSQARAKELGGL